MARFNRVTIVGLGLIGGSLGMALRRRRLATRVVGLSRTRARINRAKALGAIDEGFTLAEAAVGDAEIVVLATPVDAMLPLGKRLASLMKPGSILTDVGSTKRRIVQGFERGLADGIAFVGAHPLAGSEQQGIEAASPDLFTDALCIVTPTKRTDRRAVRAVTTLWKPLVRRVVTMDPERHDRVLAAVSHLPHVLAFCLVSATDRQALELAPRSFLDATRVAQSDPELWDDILLSNREAVLAAMSAFDRSWRQLHQMLTHRQRTALKRFLAHARTQRTRTHGT